MLRRARASAVGEMSTPVTFVSRVGDRRERRRRGMQPVPVQRSRMRICFGSVRREGVERRIEERRYVYSSVACLGVALDRSGKTEGLSYRGIRTPFLQRMSRSPKGCEPSIYWSGTPRARFLTRFTTHLRRNSTGASFFLPNFVSSLASTCCRSHRSSLWADGSVRHVLSSKGSSGLMVNACRRSSLERRGIAF